MKIKLLLSALFISGAAFAQEPIPAFYNFTPNVEEDAYVVAGSLLPVDQSASGENVVWNFNQLIQETQSSTRVIAPSATDVATFPGSTMLVRTSTEVTGGENITNYYLATSAAGGFAITGFQTPQMELNYSTSNGFVGNFPLSYGYTNTDTNISGTFTGLGVSGTFAGTGTTTVDAYGTLTVNVGSANATPVTRLKIVQDISLTYSGLPAGTITQTIYSYYSTTLTTGPIFRSISTTLNVPLLGIVDNITTNYESYMATALNTAEFANKNSVSIAPNPVKDVLHFAGDKAITGVIITDSSGRVVLQSKAGNDIDVNNLSSGVYYVALQSGTGTEVQKMVKR